MKKKLKEKNLTQVFTIENNENVSEVFSCFQVDLDKYGILKQSKGNKKLSKNQISKFKKDCIVLGIESSCDETSASIVKNGREVLSNVVSSQIEIHKKFGGVVPEVASRNHLLAISNVVDEAICQAKIEKSQINAVAVTFGAGLIGALMVGVNFAKSFARALGVPLVGVNHIRGHIAANYIIDKELVPPFYALVVSGGHTALLFIDSYTTQKKLLTTTDDAIGECFDKVARVLGLSYPGGPNIEKLARTGEAVCKFNYKESSAKDNFSYSGLKTAVINYVNSFEQKGELINVANIACTFQYLAVKQLIDKVSPIVKNSKNKTLVICGGVSANNYLKYEFKKSSELNGFKVIVPPIQLCTDNAAMIASEGYFQLISGGELAYDDLSAKSNLPL